MAGSFARQLCRLIPSEPAPKKFFEEEAMKLGNMLRVTMLFICVSVLFCAGCGKRPVTPRTPPAPAAQATTLHTLAESAYQIANALDSGEKEFEALYTSGLPGVSDDDYAKTVGGIFLKAQQANQEYTARLKSLSQIDPSNKQQVIAWTTEWFGSINRLTGEGVLGIKNADARAKLQALLAPIPGAIKTIAGVLGIVLDLTNSVQSGPAMCPAQIFTEVNFGPRDSTKTNRSWNRDGGEHSRISEAVRNALGDKVFALMQSADDKTQSKTLKGLLELGWLLAQQRKLELQERKQQTDERALELKIQAVRDKVAALKKDVEGGGKKKQLSPEQLKQRVDEIYGLSAA
jgi:hypothetical protein